LLPRLIQLLIPQPMPPPDSRLPSGALKQSPSDPYGASSILGGHSDKIRIEILPNLSKKAIKLLPRHLWRLSSLANLGRHLSREIFDLKSHLGGRLNTLHFPSRQVGFLNQPGFHFEPPATNGR